MRPLQPVRQPASTDIGVNSTRETNAAADLLSAGRSEHDG